MPTAFDWASVPEREQSILDELAERFNLPDGERGKGSKGLNARLPGSRAVLMYWRRPPSGSRGMIYYLGHPAVNEDPIVGVEVVIEGATWTARVVRVDRPAPPDRPKEYPVARPAHGIRQTVNIARDLVDTVAAEWNVTTSGGE